MPKRVLICTLSTAIALLASGCASLTHTRYTAPELPVATSFDATPLGVRAAQGGQWWNTFDDPRLTALVDQVLARNANLAAAGLTLKQARMSAALARQGLFPSGSASASSSASKALDGGTPWSKSSSGSLNASWELDLFGKLSAQADASSWTAKATEQDLASTRLSLIATTAEAWWQLGYANEQITIGADSIAYVRRLLDLVNKQYAAGAISRIDVRDAEQTVASQEAAQTQLIQARVQAIKTLAALLNQQDYTGEDIKTLPTQDLPTIAPGLPASLLSRRPDLAAAELRLRSTLATSDATAASYYPSLSLTGSLGSSSTGLLGFLSNPFASLGAAISVAELNPEKIRLGIGVARADYDIAVQNFRQTFYDALRDTQTALSERDQYILQATSLEQNYTAARAAEVLYDRRYRAGYITLRDLLDAQNRTRTALSSLVQNRYNRLVSQVQVYEALGGDTATGGGAVQ
ncbi:efflux transporter outer membrane factor lipoprotein 1 [Novosphingobium sp. Rr 2-17]|uniref:efflux transporter outer membrane subunit n=1 Tax=Novosphingobium sp. Rr 2-17 TaxID=555793 RepID=UPI000269A53E|nr:efflux transporter outer membrane subunit [Novosphingobium sp. Rr 2-17]EIZ78521.1 efflux transporter outer membrane factor lipoprotein 1 [Novosphingobium sp. Rr 2-17]